MNAQKSDKRIIIVDKRRLQKNYRPIEIRSNSNSRTKTCHSNKLMQIMIRMHRQIIADQQHGACARLRDLRRILAFANISAQPLFKFLIYLPLQVFFLWDFHFLGLIERWQRRSRKHVRRWFEALGELEALSSLAGLAHDNPGWPFPTVEVRVPKGIEALGQGHPLLPEQDRVPNDVAVGPPGTFLFVTGSNMSGKTTLLRALGTNIVLAQAGAPVCAARLRMSPLVLVTDMRIHDSLVDGVSMFMAALHQLKRVVDSARRLRIVVEKRYHCYRFLMSFS